jgi:hypothetical protein
MAERRRNRPAHAIHDFRQDETMKPEFTKLWNNYPTEQSPCDKVATNQCAIRMSLALNAEGTIKINENTYTEPKCAHGHARGAESLANHLYTAIGLPVKYTDVQKAKDKLKGKNGIIFFKDCFVRANETAQDGDHIDLWRLGETKGFSDPGNASAQVWFWTLL